MLSLLRFKTVLLHVGRVFGRVSGGERCPRAAGSALRIAKGERRQDSCEPNKHEESVPSRVCKTWENAEMTNRRQQNLKGRRA